MKVDGGDYNVGCYDMIMALEWIQENIKQFGGEAVVVVVVE